MADFESFYGGRPGKSFTIKDSFKTIKDMIAGADHFYGDYFIINSINPNDPDHGNVYMRDPAVSASSITGDLDGYKYIGNFKGPTGKRPEILFTDNFFDSTIETFDSYVRRILSESNNHWNIFTDTTPTAISIDKSNEDNNEEAIKGGIDIKTEMSVYIVGRTEDGFFTKIETESEVSSLKNEEFFGYIIACDLGVPSIYTVKYFALREDDSGKYFYTVEKDGDSEEKEYKGPWLECTEEGFNLYIGQRKSGLIGKAITNLRAIKRGQMYYTDTNGKALDKNLYVFRTINNHSDANEEDMSSVYYQFGEDGTPNAIMISSKLDSEEIKESFKTLIDFGEFKGNPKTDFDKYIPFYCDSYELQTIEDNKDWPEDGNYFISDEHHIIGVTKEKNELYAYYHGWGGTENKSDFPFKKELIGVLNEVKTAHACTAEKDLGKFYFEFTDGSISDPIDIGNVADDAFKFHGLISGDPADSNYDPNYPPKYGFWLEKEFNNAGTVTQIVLYKSGNPPIRLKEIAVEPGDPRRFLAFYEYKNEVAEDGFYFDSRTPVKMSKTVKVIDNIYQKFAMDATDKENIKRPFGGDIQYTKGIKLKENPSDLQDRFDLEYLSGDSYIEEEWIEGEKKHTARLYIYEEQPHYLIYKVEDPTAEDLKPDNGNNDNTGGGGTQNPPSGGGDNTGDGGNTGGGDNTGDGGNTDTPNPPEEEIYYNVTINYDDDDRTPTKTESVKAGTYYNIPSVENREGYEFKGWINSKGESFSVGNSVQINSDEVFTARWLKIQEEENIITVFLHNCNGRFDPITEVTFDINGTIPSLPSLEGIDNSEIFIGWFFDEYYSDSAQIYSYEGLEHGADLYAKWNFTIQFLDDNGSVISTESANSKEYINEPSNIPEKEGYIFNGWEDEEGNTYIFPIQATKGLKLKPKWAIDSRDFFEYDEIDKITFKPIIEDILSIDSIDNEQLDIANSSNFVIGAKNEILSISGNQPSAFSLDDDIMLLSDFSEGNFSGNEIMTLSDNYSLVSDENTSNDIILHFPEEFTIDGETLILSLSDGPSDSDKEEPDTQDKYEEGDIENESFIEGWFYKYYKNSNRLFIKEDFSDIGEVKDEILKINIDHEKIQSSVLDDNITLWLREKGKTFETPSVTYRYAFINREIDESIILYDLVKQQDRWEYTRQEFKSKINRPNISIKRRVVKYNK